MSESLEEQEMLWEYKPQASVCTAFPSFPKLSQVFLELDRNTENMFSIISFRKHRDEKKKNNLFTLIIKSKFSLLASSMHQQLMLEQCLYRVIEIKSVCTFS